MDITLLIGVIVAVTLVIIGVVVMGLKAQTSLTEEIDELEQGSDRKETDHNGEFSASEEFPKSSRLS